ncbi:MAG: site-specific integrase [Muribaculaceae bacterium]|nr:site-specific integrase [Muribaculaceae bacterium]
MQRIIHQLHINGRARTSETYSAALRSFARFRNGADLPIKHITSELMEEYQGYMVRRGLIPNTISFYMRILRATYNRAVEQGIVNQSYPFRHVYTGIEKTRKRALPMKYIRSIKALGPDLPRNIDFARDMFMLSLYLRGMSFIDMAFLKKTDLQNGYITYRRRKTGKKLMIRWTGEMQSILDKYPRNTSIYLLPIITRPSTRERSVYRNVGYQINRHLKHIALMIGIESNLTLYCARHSWATIAHEKGIPVHVISEGMGHDSETTTRIYLASLDSSVIDHANDIIINSI